MKISLYCQYFCMSENVFVWRYSAYFFPCVMYTKSMYAVFVQKTVRESIFRIQIEYRLQSMHNHMEGRPGSILSPLYCILLGRNGLGLARAEFKSHCTVHS